MGASDSGVGEGADCGRGQAREGSCLKAVYAPAPSAKSERPICRTTCKASLALAAATDRLHKAPQTQRPRVLLHDRIRWIVPEAVGSGYVGRSAAGVRARKGAQHYDPSRCADGVLAVAAPRGRRMRQRVIGLACDADPVDHLGNIRAGMHSQSVHEKHTDTPRSA